MRKIPAQLAAAALAVVVAAAPVLAEPEVSITSPATGSTISRSASPTINVAGLAAFDTPVPTERQLFLRREECSTTAGFLSDSGGTNAGNACEGFPAFGLVAAGAIDYSHVFPATEEEVQLPITVDASRNLTGQINFRSNTDTPAWQHFDVEIRLGDTALPMQSVNDGTPQTTSFRTINLNVPIPQSLDKVDVNEISVTVFYRRSTATWVELVSPASSFEIPAYTASFNRKVELAVGNGAFSSTGVVTDAAAGTWTRNGLTTPAVGSHFLRARAVQGNQVSPVSQIAIGVTA